MRGGNIFRISVLDAGRILLQHLQVFPEVQPDDAVRQLRFGPTILSNYDFGMALELLKRPGEPVFKILGDRQAELRHTIFEMARHDKPFWARTSVYGRQKVLKLVNEDQAQCLRDAGLLDVPLTNECQSWWDRLSLEFRLVKQCEQQNLGRRAELLTLEFERQRLFRLGLHAEPQLVSVEDQTLGYDIQSYDLVSGQVRKLFIEAKGTNSTVPKFFVSRNEWDVCLRCERDYVFYVWDLTNETLKTFRKEDLQAHMPVDQGSGVWMDTRLTLR